VPDQVTAEQETVERQTAEIAGCFFDLIGRIVGQAEQVAQALSIPSSFIKALHTLECPMAMKELGKRMHCDPSFVTLITDMLEKRGLAHREPGLTDRRIKNVVLTEDGLALKHKVEAEITERMPWNTALSEDERAQLLALIRKMLAAAPTPAPAPASDATGAGMATDDPMQGQLASLLVGALHEHVTQVNPDVPPASAGGGE
jgi:MarR family transcriptional regulator, organic hydroperoxide resistance regulator